MESSLKILFSISENLNIWKMFVLFESLMLPTCLRLSRMEYWMVERHIIGQIFLIFMFSERYDSGPKRIGEEYYQKGNEGQIIQTSQTGKMYEEDHNLLLLSSTNTPVDVLRHSNKMDTARSWFSNMKVLFITWHEIVGDHVLYHIIFYHFMYHIMLEYIASKFITYYVLCCLLDWLLSSVVVSCSVL